MKTIYSSILIAAVAVCAASCNAWLDDVKQTSIVSDETVWQNESSVDNCINRFYLYIADYGQFGVAQYQGNLTECLTDTFNYGSTNLGVRMGEPYYMLVTPNSITADGGCMYSVWQSGIAYRNIREVNQFLALQKKYSKFSDLKNNLWEAQARFFRAYIYFQLAKRHGGVILYDDLPTDGQRALSTAEETWDFIQDDLDFAAENLPVEWASENRGRLTKGMVWAFKSRVMLYAERWQEAYDAAALVNALDMYSLESNYANAWKGNNSEAILEFDYDSTNGPWHDFDCNYVPACDGYPYGALGTPTQEMVECYETWDGKKVDWSPWHGKNTETPPYAMLEPRFKATIIYRGCTWKGKTMDCSLGGENGEYVPYGQQPTTYGKTTTGYFLRKLLDESNTDVQNRHPSQSWVEIRYAEVLLNQAEAAYHLKKDGEAQALLNQVRARVGLPAKTSTGEKWFEDYRNERKVELAYEGHLFWDMRRWKLAHIEYNHYRTHGFCINGSNNTYEYVDCDGKDRLFDSKYYVLPVPQGERNNNLLVGQYDEWL